MSLPSLLLPLHIGADGDKRDRKALLDFAKYAFVELPEPERKVLTLVARTMQREFQDRR